MFDLTYPIREHFRWPVGLSFKGDQAAGDVFRITTLNAPVHAFTHIDAPRHILGEGATIESIDLERVVGDFEVLDLSFIEDDAPIGIAELERAAKGRRSARRWLLKTVWPARRSIDDRTFWTQSPFVTREGALWLKQSGAIAIAFDFPQDATIRKLLDGGPCPPLVEHVTHDILLKEGVTLIEYVANTQAITTEQIWLCALPLKIDGADGAPARIVGWPR